MNKGYEKRRLYDTRLAKSSTNAETLTMLADRNEPPIDDVLVKNPSCPPEVLFELHRKHRIRYLEDILKNPNCPAAVLVAEFERISTGNEENLKYLSSPSYRHYSLIALHLNTPSEILALMAPHSENARNNPNCPVFARVVHSIREM